MTKRTPTPRGSARGGTPRATPKTKGKKTAASRPKLSQRKKALRQDAFLAAFASCGNISTAAILADVNRKEHYRWLEADPAYADRYEQANEQAADALEQEARRRAVEGVEEPVGWFQGQAGGTVRKYSDTLLIFLLKGARPEKYRERYEHTGKDGQALFPQTIRFGDREIKF